MITRKTIITGRLLAEMGACKYEVLHFEELFPEGCKVTKANLRKCARHDILDAGGVPVGLGHIDILWFMTRVLHRSEWKKIWHSIRDEYDNWNDTPGWFNRHYMKWINHAIDIFMVAIKDELNHNILFLECLDSYEVSNGTLP